MSAFVFPLSIAVVTSRTYARADTTMVQDTACDWSLQESCKLLIAYSQLLLIQRTLSY